MFSNDENKAEPQTAQIDERSSPGQIPDPVLNIVMHKKKICFLNSS